jgi:hypothetical protein
VNLAGRVNFFSKMAFGKYLRVWRVLTKRFGICRRVWRVLNFSDKGHFGECDYSINMPNLPNLEKTLFCQHFGTFFLKNGIWRMSACLASPCKTVWQMLAILASPCKTVW